MPAAHSSCWPGARARARRAVGGRPRRPRPGERRPRRRRFVRAGSAGIREAVDEEAGGLLTEAKWAGRPPAARHGGIAATAGGVDEQQRLAGIALAGNDGLAAPTMSGCVVMTNRPAPTWSSAIIVANTRFSQSGCRRRSAAGTEPRSKGRWAEAAGISAASACTVAPDKVAARRPASSTVSDATAPPPPEPEKTATLASRERAGWPSRGLHHQFERIVDDDRAGVAHACLEGVVGTRHAGGMRLHRALAGIGTPRLGQQHRLAGGPRAAQQVREAQRILQPLDIEGDDAGVRIRDGVFEEIADLRVGPVAERDAEAEAGAVS